MLHGLIPTLHPVDLKCPAASKSSSETPSIALPRQTAPDSFGSDMQPRLRPQQHEAEGSSKKNPKGCAVETRKRKTLMTKLDGRVRLLHEKLEEMLVIKDDMQCCTLVCLGRIIWLDQ